MSHDDWTGNADHSPPPGLIPPYDVEPDDEPDEPWLPGPLPCYDCTRLAGKSVLNEAECIHRKVVALGPVVNPHDPTQSYKLECGHIAI